MSGFFIKDTTFDFPVKGFLIIISISYGLFRTSSGGGLRRSLNACIRWLQVSAVVIRISPFGFWKGPGIAKYRHSS